MLSCEKDVKKEGKQARKMTEYIRR